MTTDIAFQTSTKSPLSPPFEKGGKWGDFNAVTKCDFHKLNKLKSILKEMGSVLVAYSGGVDSTFLLKAASDVLKDNVLAVIADSPIYPPDEVTFSKQMARQIGVRYKLIKTYQLNNSRFLKNNPNRCYLCKRELFSKLKIIARRNKLNFVVDGSNISDNKDFRPGDKAARELKIRSPLKEAGFEKEDIRRISKRIGLRTHSKPSLACLASRVAYRINITQGTLKRIELAERHIKSLGFKQVRVRDYGSLARIEVEKENIRKLVTIYQLPVTDYLRKIGYNYITVDLEGYRAGSMNEVIHRVGDV